MLGRQLGGVVASVVVIAAACGDSGSNVDAATSATSGAVTSTTGSASVTSTATGAGGSGAGSSASTTTATTGQGGAGGAGGSGQGGGGGAPPLTVAQCYADDFVNPPMGGPDYDQFGPIVGSHCMGTNHQDITGVERVVFVGDSVTVGTPPTLSADYYRSQLADALAAKFGLQAPGFLWKLANFVTGEASVMVDGDFASCAKWGARTDDLMVDNTQIETCIGPADLDKRTLVVMTMGGNDISSLTQDFIDGVPLAEIEISAQAFVESLEMAIEWLKTPGLFPNGVYVVFANMYEFTDATGNVQSCDVSGLAGFGDPIPNPDELKSLVVWANEQYLRIAVDHGVDMIFMLEDFCGHGFEKDNPASPCYRGPGQEQWFDLTCIHPNPAGHDHVTEMFMAVVNE